MPAKSWKHDCRFGAISLRVEVCWICGKRGRYEGWTYLMFEAMGVYQRLYGLKPIGPHRPLADKLYSRSTVCCTRCRGTGLIEVKNAKAFAPCDHCKGLRRLFVVSAKTRSEIRARVLQKFPEASLKTNSEIERLNQQR